MDLHTLDNQQPAKVHCPMDGIGNGMNATNTIRATIFSDKAERRITDDFERLVDYFTGADVTQGVADAMWNSPVTGTPIHVPKVAKDRIQALEKELAEANAKLSNRL